MLNQNFVIIGAIIRTIGVAGYIKDTVSGRIKPNRVSFLLWSFAPLIAFFAQIKQGVGIQSLLTFSVGFFPLLIFIASFLNKKAEWKLTKFDFICAILSLLGLILWIVTKVGNIAIIFGIFADFLAALPTIKKSYFHPETESAWPWLAAIISDVLTILTITNWNFANFGFPLYIFFIEVTIFVLVQFKIGKKLHKIN